jgi:ATP-dependent Clp protease ATP-binding subunit ClpX
MGKKTQGTFEDTMKAAKEQAAEQAISQILDGLAEKMKDVEEKLSVTNFPFHEESEDSNEDGGAPVTGKEAASAYMYGYTDGFCSTLPRQAAGSVKAAILNNEDGYPLFDIRDGKGRLKASSLLYGDLKDLREEKIAVEKESVESKLASLDRIQSVRERKLFGNNPYSMSLEPFARIAKSSPKDIQAKLAEHVLGQEDLTRQAATFLYYHAQRMVHPELEMPVRPMLVAGPSGSGKTEVWRTAKRLFHIPVEVVDASKFTSEGFKGNQKFSSVITPEAAYGTIFVMDEFDKLCEPHWTSQGENVSYAVMSEFLKYVEGDTIVCQTKESGPGFELDTSVFSFVLVGAFQAIFDKKKDQAKDKAPLGFGAPEDTGEKDVDFQGLSDKELIDYGIRNELVGRISTRCVTRKLEREDYLSIAFSPNSRTMRLLKSFQELYGINYTFSDEQLDRYIEQSLENDTGVRGFLNAMENDLTDSLYEAIPAGGMEDSGSSTGTGTERVYPRRTGTVTEPDS